MQRTLFGHVPLSLPPARCGRQRQQVAARRLLHGEPILPMLCLQPCKSYSVMFSQYRAPYMPSTYAPTHIRCVRCTVCVRYCTTTNCGMISRPCAPSYHPACSHQDRQRHSCGCGNHLVRRGAQPRSSAMAKSPRADTFGNSRKAMSGPCSPHTIRGVNTFAGRS